MYLKRLEIQGFKSFADKVEFEFPSGITAIVGPNGSGKSNVVDGIRWVLGEQSVKNLRGSKMEDVIFAGSSDRRAIGMAQVSMTIDNSEHVLPLDFDEVTVTRRLYRSGESEYLINKSTCRLKDIHELFMDTGLGREGLSIISQGKVDEILTLKPEDRRGLIEEAAGIIKYKYRKREAERKLADTEENMIRIHDIISELSERLGPLGEQAEKASQYKEWKAELDQLEISLDVADIEKNKSKETDLLAEKSSIENHVANYAAQIAKNEAQLSEEKLAEQEEEEAISQLQQAFFLLQNDVERRQNEIQAAQAMDSHLTGQKQQAETELALQQQELHKLQGQIARHQVEEADSKLAFEQQQQEVRITEQQAAEDEQRGLQLQQNVEEQKNQQFANLQEQARNHNEMQRLRQELSGGDKYKERLEEKLSQLYEQQEQLQQQHKELAAADEEQSQLQQRHLQKIEAMEQQLEQRKHHQFVQQQELNKLQLSYQETISKGKALAELESSGEGYQYGVKSVLEQKNKGKLEGIIGTVAQLIQVPREIEKAVETAMGVSLQNIVTENDSQAQAAIQYLKSQKKGRATFLPLNTVKGVRSEEDLGKEKGVLGLAVDLISFDERYRQILQHLLGRIWIVENLVSAVDIGKKRGFSHRLVTLDGELITPGGALTGGNHGKDHGGLLARQRQISELTQRAEQLHQQMDERNGQLDVYYEQTNQHKLELESWKEERTAYVKVLAELHQQLEQSRREQQRINGEIELEQLSLAEKNQELATAETALSQLQQQEQQLKHREVQLAEQLSQLQEQQQQHSQQAKERQEGLNQTRIQFATAQQRWQLLQEQFVEIEQRAAQLAQQIAQKEDDLQGLLQQQQEKQQEIADNQQYIQSHTVQLQEENRRLEQKKNARSQRREAMNRLEEQIRELRKLFDQVNEKKYQLDLELNRVQGFLNSTTRRLEQNFGLTFEAAVAISVKIDNWSEAQKKIQQRKGQLRSLGEINFTAIEEFEQVNERLSFLTVQVADLQEAKQSLHKVIQEMEKIMAAKFQETYHEVNAYFSTVFENMFGGGKARLELSDPDDYLLTGIEIIAQPPGKKEQVLTLLSGGERAMTAIALLLSLLSVKPSPFCILDEIESALDDANVDRFARFIKEYSAKTQFLVISHRKGTMEAADTLFGIAMENKGVSRLMSVKISDYE